MKSMKKLPTWVEVDLDRLSQNIKQIRQGLRPGAGVLLTVKADAYGHGAVQVAQASSKLVDMFGVATLDEAIELREAGIKTKILILSPILATEVPAVAYAGLTVTISTREIAAELSRYAVEHDKVIDVRNFGLMGAIELAPRDGAPGARGLEVHKRAFWDEQLVIRNGMDVLQFSPFLNSKPDEMEASFDAVRRILDTLE